jgi:hypothetical protein
MQLFYIVILNQAMFFMGQWFGLQPVQMHFIFTGLVVFPPLVFCFCYFLDYAPLLRDYAAEIEATVTAKLSTWKPQHLSLWADLVEPNGVQANPVTAVELMEIEDQAQASRFREVRAKLSQDIAAMTAYNNAKAENSRRGHVVGVMHQKAQMSVGKQFLDCVYCVSFG